MDSVRGSFVFRHQNNNPRNFDQVLIKAEIEKYDELDRRLTTHSFRHTYATLMASLLGDNRFMLKAILSQKKLSTTERYCHPKAPSLGPVFEGICLFD